MNILDKSDSRYLPQNRHHIDKSIIQEIAILSQLIPIQSTAIDALTVLGKSRMQTMQQEFSLTMQ